MACLLLSIPKPLFGEVSDARVSHSRIGAYPTFVTLSAVIQTYQARIYVTLRPSVLDPAGTAVQSGLKHLGYDNVEQVRIGKYIELKLSAADADSARSQLDQICYQLLANPVIESYRFELTEVSTSLGTGAVS
jgi:phosphoribosylformylglycinamidine synthase